MIVDRGTVLVPLKDQNRLVQAFHNRESRGPIAPGLIALRAVDPPQPDLDSNPLPSLDRDRVAIVDRGDPTGEGVLGQRRADPGQGQRQNRPARIRPALPIFVPLR